jgi:hypothetical protein
MGARGCLLYTEQVPDGLLTLISRRGSPLLLSRGSCRSRVLRGMGARGRLLYTEQVPGGLLTLISHRGSPLLRAGGSPRSRVPLAWQGTRALKRLAVVAAVLQHRRAFLGAAFVRARVVGGAAGGRDGFASAAAHLCRNDDPPAVLLRSWWGPPVRRDGKIPCS